MYFCPVSSKTFDKVHQTLDIYKLVAYLFHIRYCEDQHNSHVQFVKNPFGIPNR